MLIYGMKDHSDDFTLFLTHFQKVICAFQIVFVPWCTFVSNISFSEVKNALKLTYFAPQHSTLVLLILSLT